MLQIWREPLLHFLLIGAVLFGLYAYLNPVAEGDDPRTIVVNEQKLLTYLQYRSRAFDPERFKGVLEGMPDEELTQLARDYIQEEALYREANAMELGKSDYVARLRLIQQLEFLFRGFVDVDRELTDKEVESHWREHRDSYREPAKVTFTHIFFSDPEGGHEARQRAEEQLKRAPVRFVEAAAHGDRFLYHTNYVERGRDMVASHFGDPLADAVFALEPDADTWRGPFRSPHGYHLVLLTRRDEGRTPSLAELRDQVEQDARDALVNDKVAELVKAVVEDYRVELVDFAERVDFKRGS